MACHHHHHHSSPCPPPSFTCPPPPPPPSCPCCPHQPTPDLLVHHHHHQNPNPTFQRRQTHHQKLHFKPQSDTHFPFLFESLLHRIESLESIISQYSSSNSCSVSGRLRDVAARTIQFYFRRFLVRRSIAFRQLKELAGIKARLAGLVAAARGGGRVDFGVVMGNGMDLLIWVDSIQASDRMIRDNKRVITREIVRFLEFVDELNVEKLERKRLTKMKVSKSGRMVSGGVGDIRMRGLNGRDYEKLSRRNVVSEGYDLSDHREKPVKGLRERVERIRRLSRELEDEDKDEVVEFDEFKHFVAQDGGDGERDVASEGYDLANRGERPLKELRERVERIRRLSKELQDEEEVENAEFNGFKLDIPRDGRVDGMRTYPRNYKDGVHVPSKGSLRPNDGKHVSFLDKDQIKVVHSVPVESDEEEEESEGSSQASDHDGENTKRDFTAPTYNEDDMNHQGRNEEHVFSAPLPVKMESRAEVMKNKKNQGVKITD